MKKFLSMSMLALGMLVANTASATPVSLELLLLVDVSGSISNSEYNLQKNGYADTFRSASIQNLIEAQEGGIAVFCLVQDGLFDCCTFSICSPVRWKSSRA